jgi:hypothetical protein
LAPDRTRQPGAKALSAAQTPDTDLMESLVFEGHDGQQASRCVGGGVTKKRD